MVMRTYIKSVLPGKLGEELVTVVPDIDVQTIYMKQVEGADVCHLLLDREPTAVEDQDLHAAVMAHIPSILGYKIWAYVETPPVAWTSPKDLVYTRGLSVRLHPKNYFTQGELTKREYYSGASVNTDGTISFTNLILKEENVFLRDPAGLAILRTQTISWTRDDDSFGPDVKTTQKFYAGIDKIQEGQTRRGNLKDALMMEVAIMLITNATIAKGAALTMLETEAEFQKGRLLLAEYGKSFADFVDHSNKQILTDITTDTTHTWLGDTAPGSTDTIRSLVLAELTI